MLDHDGLELGTMLQRPRNAYDCLQAGIKKRFFSILSHLANVTSGTRHEPNSFALHLLGKAATATS